MRLPRGLMWAVILCHVGAVTSTNVGCGSRSPSTTSTAAPKSQTQPLANFELTGPMVERHNRGVALMGQFDFGKAHGIFARLVEEYPLWTAARVDLAIAALNRRQPGDEGAAASLLDQVLQREPGNLRALYCRALLHQVAGELDQALRLFRQVAAADPKDGYAAYFMGQCLLDMSNLDDALNEFRRAQEIDPYLRSAYYGAFRVAQRQKQTEVAQQELEQFQKLVTNPQARLAEIKYTRMGPKAEVRPIAFHGDQPSVAAPPGPVFADPVPAGVLVDDGYRWREFDSADRSSITVCDVDGDERLDLFIVRALERNNATLNALLFHRSGAFELDLNHPLATVSHVHAALWGDYDNDGLTDVYLCRQGPNQLWKQTEPGTWQNVSESTKTGGGDLSTVDGAMFDADHDGDLDLLLVNEDGPNELLNNNLDGTFRPLAHDQGIAGDGRPSRGLVVADLDGDRDVDLIIVNKDPPHEVYLNDRLWSYRKAPGFDAFRQAPILAALAVDSGILGEGTEDVTEGGWSEIEAVAAGAVADGAADGQVELVTISAGGVTRWAAGTTGTWTPQSLAVNANLPSRAGTLAIQDVNGDGRLDLVLSTDAGWMATELVGMASPLYQANADSVHRWVVAMLDDQPGPSVVGLRSGMEPLIWGPGPGRYPLTAFSFTGREDKVEQTRSNVSGIGVKVAVRAGGQFAAIDTYRQHSGPGQSLQPVAIGLGPAKRLDLVRITWPDGVIQTEMDLAAGILHRIEETQRQVSSCPVVFAWNGQRYEFVTDILGAGGIGFNTGAGQYVEPRPWENLLLPEGALVDERGRYAVKVAEPMEEACYFDAARLTAYDLPPGWRMTIDERFSQLVPLPTGAPVLYRKCLVPRLAVNDRGDEVTDQIRDADLVAAPPGSADCRFVGRTTEHTVTLTFAESIDRFAERPVLIMNGWIEYPYSQTMFAAWQAGTPYEAPTIEARGAEGRWRVVLDQFGYLAGMPREGSVPLPKARLPAGTTQLRIRTNMEIYWDRLAVAAAEPCADVIRNPLPLAGAWVQEVGFAQRPRLSQHRPYYDYDRRTPLWDTQHQAGFYTRFGPVTPLVAQTDDAVAIIGPGEEIHGEFHTAARDVPPGWTRRFVLETAGWCKDRDLYTKDGDTLAPLPRRDPLTPDESRRRTRLHQIFNTRYRSGG